MTTFHRIIASLIFALLLSSTCLQLQAADEVVTFANPEHKVLYKQLLREYRCLKCQNQNLADSNAGLAGDLRREIREQIEAGNSQSDIEHYLVARYGEFVLYRPRLTSKTLILWIGPFVLFIVGIVSLVIMVRGKSKATRYSGGESMADSGSGTTAAAIVSSSPKPGSVSVAAQTNASELPDAEKLARARELLRKR